MEPCAGALHGVRVLNLADISGAYCAKLLADLGADVIAVEPPGGSPMRHVGPFYGGARNLNRSICFWHYHTNQRSVMLDLETADGRRRLRDLAVSADILVETSTPESLEHLGLGYQHLSACNPGLIVVSITPFGQTGPHRFQRTTDLVAQAVGGMLSVNGTPDAPPLPGAGLPAYHSASMYGAIGALLALHARHATGRGQRVDISLQESVLACVEHASSLFHHEGRIASRQGGLHWTRDFHVGRCADGYVVHGTLGDWTSLAEWVKAEALAQELAGPEWEDVVYRRTHCRQLFAILDAWARHQRAHDLVEGAQLRRLPYARVRPPEALRNDAQLRARGFYVAVPHPELSTTLTYPGAPYVFSRTPWCIHRRPPLLGEHAGAVWHAGEEAGSAASRVPHSSDPLSSRRGLGPSTADRQPLRGLRVLDFTWVVAGPLATRILADHGAEVIKVERPGAGDFGSRRGGLTGNLNRGKRSIVIDMGNRVGLQLAQRLAAASDVVIDNFSARVMSNWGLDDGRLRELNPRIVAVHMSGFGRSGPARDHVSYGPTLQALCGHTWLMRSRGEPVGWGFSYSDMVAGVSAAFAVLAALWHRRRTGEGQCIDLSQFENLTALLGPGLLNLLVDGGTWPEIDNGSQEVPSAPHGVYRCADRAGSATTQDSWCAISVCGEQEWGCFQRAIGDPAWTRAPEFVSAAARRAHRTALDAHVEAWTRPRAAALVAARLQACGVRAGVVADARVLCCSDPHLLARQYWVHLHTPEGEPVALDGVPMKLSDTSACVRTPGPLLGEHTDPVLREVLGMTAADIAALRHTNVVA